MKNKTIEKLTFKKIWPYCLFTLLWTIFSLWICIKENEYLWSILLIGIGIIPLVWEIFIASSIKEIETIANENKLLAGERSILSTEGRIRRRTYWTRAIIVFIVNILAHVLFKIESLTAGVSFLLTIFMIIQGVKRMHDINKSGGYIFIPIYNLILTLTEGTPGRNNYGDDPKTNS